VLDADGNWEAGLRLPHVSSTVRGRRAGASLGTYHPLNEVGRDPFNPFALISGTFTRFSDAEILVSYPTRQTSVRRVVLPAVSLAERHYITTPTLRRSSWRLGTSPCPTHCTCVSARVRDLPPRF
jgi:hypothetical protein